MFANLAIPLLADQEQTQHWVLRNGWSVLVIPRHTDGMTMVDEVGIQPEKAFRRADCENIGCGL